jgi:hypothetical protein
MHDLGGCRAADATIFSVFQEGLQHLEIDRRIQIGMDLLQRAVKSKNEDRALQLVGKLESDFVSLPSEDVRKSKLAKLRITAFDKACAYDKATVAITEAAEWADNQFAGWLAAELNRMKLLQGDFSFEGESDA